MPQVTLATRFGISALALLLAFAPASVPVSAETIVPATYDVDTYMFVGLNTDAERGLTLTEDYSLGIVAQNNAHFIFSVIKFDDLSGLATKASGGGDKFLRLATDTFPGPATVAVSIAQADIHADDATGYPSIIFPGNRNGLNTDRLRWYMQNIKGNDPTYGGYAGGAPHVGVWNITAPGTYQLDVTAAVDAWLTGAQPNFGFGLWGISVSGEQGNTFDFRSLENPDGNGPALVVTGQSSGPSPGDANNDGVVDLRDLAQLMANFGRAAGATWADGDFDGNGSITLADVLIVRSHLAPLAPASAAAAIPEPGSLALGLLAAIALTVAATKRRSTKPTNSIGRRQRNARPQTQQRTAARFASHVKKGYFVMQLVEQLSFTRRWLIRGAFCAAVLASGTLARAEVLATATWDTDSYVYFGLNAVNSPEITLGEPLPAFLDPHYNIGFIKFDVSGLSLAGSKYLQLEPNTATAQLPSTVAIAALYGNTDDYFAAGNVDGRKAWLAANAYSQPPVATMPISAAGGKHYADITALVNNWIANPSQNYGVALWRVGGADFDSPELFSMNDPGGRGPALNSVPEPSTLALAAIAATGAFGMIVRRHRAAQTARPPAA